MSSEDLKSSDTYTSTLCWITASPFQLQQDVSVVPQEYSDILSRIRLCNLGL